MKVKITLSIERLLRVMRVKSARIADAAELRRTGPRAPASAKPSPGRRR